MALPLFVLATLLPAAGLVAEDVDDRHADLKALVDAPDRVALGSGFAGEPVEVSATTDLVPAVQVQAADTVLHASASGIRANTGGPSWLSLPVDLHRTPKATYTYASPVMGPAPVEPAAASNDHVVVTGAPATTAEGFDWTLPAQTAPAAALAALAVVHAEGWARWLPRGLRTLAPAGGLASLYTRIEKNEVLDHTTRAAIYELLQAEPGLSLEEVCSTLKLSRSTARHHLGVLETAGLVRHATEGRCRIHFPAGHHDEALQRHLLDHPQRARIVDLVSLEPLSLVELSEVLDANVGAVHFHLKKLTEGGLVQRIENGSVKYAPAR